MLFATFEADNRALRGPTVDILARIVAAPVLHARFLHTLAMLEHMGSHKIMATQHGPAIEQETLKHLAEEARHAFFFKRRAEREAGRELSPAERMAAPAARRYFQRLDAAVLRALPADADPRAAYLTMSLVVEFRAVWAYRLYQDVLARAGHNLSLKSLLAEENGHLEGMAARLASIGQFDAARIDALCRAERALYEYLLAAFDREATSPQAERGISTTCNSAPV